MTGPAHEVETSYEPHRNLVTGVVNKAKPDSKLSTKHEEPGTLSSYTYANDLLGRRETISQGGEAFGMLALGHNQVEVAYNDRSEVTGAVYRTGGEARQTFDYDYDAIGNRERTVSEIDSKRSELSYETNALNQYKKISANQRDFDDKRGGEAGRPSPASPSIAVPYDLDGNLLEDTRNTYTWNADNNLIRVDAKDGTSRIDYVYDHQSRRTVRRTHTRASATENWKLKTENFYLYDDWNLVADVSAVTGHRSGVTGEEADSVRYYTWGRDLSGSLQGAGGVGGLLAISTVHPPEATENWNLKTENFKTLYPTYDANGNVGQLINADANVVAAYAYDPFGNVTEMAGAEAAENPWRFSTKPVEAGTGWLYYGYRWYDAEMGRWVNRDPIEESGGVNLYGFVGNDGVGMVDVLGLSMAIDWAGTWANLKSSLNLNSYWQAAGHYNIFVPLPNGITQIAIKIKVTVTEGCCGNGRSYRQIKLRVTGGVSFAFSATPVEFRASAPISKTLGSCPDDDGIIGRLVVELSARSGPMSGSCSGTWNAKEGWGGSCAISYQMGTGLFSFRASQGARITATVGGEVERNEVSGNM